MRALAGRMAALLDIGLLLPRKVWYEPDSCAHDQTFWTQILAALEAERPEIYNKQYPCRASVSGIVTNGIAVIVRGGQGEKIQILNGNQVIGFVEPEAATSLQGIFQSDARAYNMIVAIVSVVAPFSGDFTIQCEKGN